MTQNERILEFLKGGRTLTQLSALRLFDSTRLAARINCLRNEGHDIQTELVVVRSGKRIARYYLKPHKERRAS